MSDEKPSADDVSIPSSVKNSDETRHHVNESHDKIRLETDLTRGSDVRDQDKHKLKARGETPEEAAENLSEALRELEERDVFARARAVGGDTDA